MGLFSRNKKPELLTCFDVEGFFSQINTDNLSLIVNKLMELKYHSFASVRVFEPRLGEYRNYWDWRYRLKTTKRWGSIEKYSAYKVPSSIKHNKPDAVDALKVLTNRASEGEAGAGKYAVLLGLIYEFGMTEGIQPNREAAERCYYIAEQCGTKIMPLFRYLRGKNFTDFYNYKDDGEAFFSICFLPR